jgi:hypothetical protein
MTTERLTAEEILKIMREYGLVTYSHNIIANKIAALIEQHYYPKEFIDWFMWQDEMGCDGCSPNDTGKLIFFNDDGTETTLEEIYQYWLTQVKK